LLDAFAQLQKQKRILKEENSANENATEEYERWGGCKMTRGIEQVFEH